jgi:hypothetical protein
MVQAVLKKDSLNFIKSRRIYENHTRTESMSA